MRLLDKLKQTAQDAANSVADSATKVKEKATDIVSVATDKETYAKIAQTLAQTINRNINHTENPDVPELKVKAIGYSGYKN